MISIADEEGKIYSVNDPDALLEAVDNDTLMSILKVTYNAKIMHTGIAGLLDRGIIAEVSEDTESSYSSSDKEHGIAEELANGVEFIKAHLSKVLTPEAAQDCLNEVEIALYGRTLTDEEKR